MVAGDVVDVGQTTLTPPYHTERSQVLEGRELAAQVKSRQRVVDHGEVFTDEREINAMLSIVEHEATRIDSRFLEPACGNGNFLAEVLARKLRTVKTRYGSSISEYEKYCFIAASSLYGVELLEDNAVECRNRLLTIVKEAHNEASKGKGDPRFLTAIQYVIWRNVLCGDALSLRDNKGKPIVFSEWSMAVGNKVKRRDFRLDEMLDGSVNHGESMSLFGSGGTSTTEWEFDKETESYIPLPIREYPLIEFYEVKSYE